MAFINGRFHMNSLFGAAVERARSGFPEPNDAGIIDKLPSLCIYSTPDIGWEDNADSPSGFCDLTATFSPHGVRCAPDKDFHGAFAVETGRPNGSRRGGDASGFCSESDFIGGPLPVGNLAVKTPSSFHDIAIRKQLFTTTAYSSAELRIQNLSGRDIIALELTLEYYGASGERFGDVIVQAMTDAVPANQLVSIGRRMSRGGAFGRIGIVRPGAVTSVGGLGWFASGECPVEAKLTAALLWFSDGTSSDWTMPGSRVDPEPTRLVLRDLPVCLAQHNIDGLFLSLSLNSAGNVLQARGFPPDLSQRDPCDVKELGEWTFQPALLDGKPVATQMNLLLRLFHAKEAARNRWLSRREAARPVTVVDATAPAHGGGSWHVLYAGALPEETAGP